MSQDTNTNARVIAQRQKNKERIEILENFVAAGVEIPCFDGVIIDRDVTISAGTTVLPGTILRGETTVGENCVLGPNTLVENSKIGNNVLLNSTQCYQSTVKDGANIGPFVHIRPNSVVGEQVHLGNFVEVKNSTIDTGTKVSHLTYVGDSDVDILTARRAGVPCISVLWGFRDRPFLERHGATCLAETPADILALLDADEG